jgi:hypothetical protein
MHTQTLKSTTQQLLNTASIRVLHLQHMQLLTMKHPAMARKLLLQPQPGHPPLNFMSSWLLMSSFPCRTSPSPPQLCSSFCCGCRLQYGRA